jgi:hypothetical protein
MIDLLPWILAAAALGLWWGERGRRLDAQRREGVIPVDAPTPAKVLQPGAPMPDPTVALKEAKERFIAETMAEGHSRKVAEAEYDRLLTRAHTDEPGAWGP